MQTKYLATNRATGQQVDFPVEWENEADAALTWRWDAEHFPLPQTPLSIDLNRDAISINRASVFFGGSPGARDLFANGYRFGPARWPQQPAGAAYQQNLSLLAHRVRQLWDEIWWPRIEREAAEVRDLDYSRHDLGQLVEAVEFATERYAQHMDLMMRAARLVGYWRTQLLDFLQQRFPGEADRLVDGMLEGTPNISMTASAELWQVSRILAGRPQLLAAARSLAEAPEVSAEASSVLGQFASGNDFLLAFEHWLERFGRRNGSFEENAEPTWYEDRRVPLHIVSTYAFDAPDPMLEHEAAQRSRERLVLETEGRLEPNDTAGFRSSLGHALAYPEVRESRPFAAHISRTAIRVPALALGQRLVEMRLLNHRDDVFYLYLNELREAGVEGTEPENFRALVAERRASWSYWAGVTPPSEVGVASAESSDADHDVLKGTGVSAGVVEARACVILSLPEAHRMRPGDILVTVATAPLWTPLFNAAAGVITEGGGMLSHAAIVAREFGLPAVVGVRGATSRIKDGDMLRLDGTTGLIHLPPARD